MQVTVRFFASLREALGPMERVTLDDASTVAALRNVLIARGGHHAENLQRGRAVRCAVNQDMVDESVVLQDGAEVAFFPPVTGG
jgi:molybdopterin synthase sulfur carrier subunit